MKTDIGPDLISGYVQTNKEVIRNAFSRGAGSYDHYAFVQQKIAGLLFENLPNSSEMYKKRIFEIGCGTGIISEKLLRNYPDSKICMTDISPQMVNMCKLKLISVPHSGAWFKVLDAEYDDIGNSFDLIVSSLTAHWFDDIHASIQKITDALNPGGMLVMSYLTNDSFPEWRNVCDTMNIACTANRLPEKEELQSVILEHDFRFEPFSVRTTFDKSHDFFKSLKKSGVNTQTGEKQLGVSDFRKLVRMWDSTEENGINITYSGELLILRKEQAI